MLLEKIKSLHKDSRETYGYRRIHAKLEQNGIFCGKNKIHRLMNQHHLCAKNRKVFVSTTQSNHNHIIAPNLLKRDFTVNAPNKIWVSDITYIRTRDGWLYLAVMIDLYSRAVVGWSMKNTLSAQLVLDALNMARLRRRPEEQLVIHSDRGIQYACSAFQYELKKYKFRCSMSRKGDCWDNAVAESFFKTLKTELIQKKVFESISIAKTKILDFIEVFYNRERLHSTVGYLSPLKFEQAA